VFSLLFSVSLSRRVKYSSRSFTTETRHNRRPAPVFNLNVNVEHSSEAQKALRDGVVLMQERKFQLAHAHFSSATHLDAELEEAWAGLGMVELMLGHERESRKAFARSNSTVAAMTRRVQKCHNALLLHPHEAFKQMSEAIALQGSSTSWSRWFELHASSLSLAASHCALPFDYLEPLLASLVTGVFAQRGLHLWFIENLFQCVA